LSRGADEKGLTRPLKAICLDGGGYLGLATASFLAEVERHFGVRIGDEFDLFCGTSTGGIIALALASGLTGNEIVELYRRLGQDVFNNKLPGSRALRKVRGLFLSRYSNRGLISALETVFRDGRLGDLKARGKYVVIPAFCLSSGTPRVFKTDHAPELSRDDKHFVRDIALATSAAPMYLPIASIRSPTSGAYEQFVDGGVYANNPALLAFTEAVGYLKRSPSDVQLLSIATPRDRGGIAEKSRPLTRWEVFRLSRGLLGWGSGLADLFIGSTAQVTHSAVDRVMLGLAGRIGGYERIELDSQSGLGLDVATDWATETLTNIGNVAGAGGAVRERVRPFLTVRGG
jgi:hypothetical protein